MLASFPLSVLLIPDYYTYPNHLPNNDRTPHFLPVPAAPRVAAKAYVLVDANSGKILASKAADQRMAPASLTKIMTLYIVSEALTSGTYSFDRHSQSQSISGTDRWLQDVSQSRPKSFCRNID